MELNDENRSRQIKDAPFCYQHKGALRMIRDCCEDGNGHSASALATYLAVSELASDAQAETFTAPISQIARRAGVSYRTASSVLNQLESLKLIAVERHLVEGTKGHAPSSYTLLTFGNGCRTLGKQNRNCLPRRLKNRNKLNTGAAHSDGSARKMTSKRQRPASPGLDGKEKNSAWLQRTPFHVLKRRREEYQNERSQLLKEYGNGAFSDPERLASFRDNAPREAQRRYDWLRPKINEIDQAIADRSRP
jgi:hypothetical protein